MEWVTSENTYEECWRRLLEFSNIEVCVSAIEKIHGEDPRQKPNYKKQAKQIRSALYQAKEYFDAAMSSSLITKPNHLYYGLVSLSTASMLLLGDGKYSLDRLRQDKKNQHHGLNFRYEPLKDNGYTGIDLLKSCHINVCSDGHFLNWYSVLPGSESQLSIKKTYTSLGSSTGMDYTSIRKNIPVDELKGIKSDLISLVKRLPDLALDFPRLGIDATFARGNIIHSFFPEESKSTQEYLFHYSHPKGALDKFFDFFIADEGVYFIFENNETKGRVKTRKDVSYPYFSPDHRETANGDCIFYAEPLRTNEIVDIFVISFALSMLSRYYPDVWIDFLESNSIGAKIIEKALLVIQSKSPNLILNEMLGWKCRISSHRPSWHI